MASNAVSASDPASASMAAGGDGPNRPPDQPKKKRSNHRGGKKRRNRRQSFAAPTDQTDGAAMSEHRPSLLDAPSPSAARSNFYRIQGGGASNTSLESQALYDHRDSIHGFPRRQSVQQNVNTSRPSPHSRSRNSQSSTARPDIGRSRLARTQNVSDLEEDQEDLDEHTGLLSASRGQLNGRSGSGYGGFDRPPSSGGRWSGRARKASTSSSKSSRRRRTIFERQPSAHDDHFDVNNPPSVPGSPTYGPEMGYDDLLLTGDLPIRGRSPDSQKTRRTPHQSREALIDIDNPREQYAHSSPPSPKGEYPPRFHPAEADVCYPQEGMSEIAEEDEEHRHSHGGTPRPRRRRARQWPDLAVLEDWATEEKEQRTMEGIRQRQISEPLLVGGRLRPQKSTWHREAEDAPFRFTYFNEEFENTLHSQTISELLRPGQTFKDLFIPEPPELEDSSSEEDDDEPLTRIQTVDTERERSRMLSPQNGQSRPTSTRQSSMTRESKQPSPDASEQHTPTQSQTHPQPGLRMKKYGPRPIFWLDVLSPTEEEMRVLSKAFGIHPLTAEDIMMQEQREKLELFRNYYFINYRTFEQDENSEDYLQPVNMYVVVFRDGVISFHFSMSPHPANVRRRIRQLNDYLIPTSDWISYAIIDDITDAYAPFIKSIEEEVDDIDYTILRLHAATQDYTDNPKVKLNKRESAREKLAESDAGSDDEENISEPAGHMLIRVGECRRKVMSLYRLLGNKADVIKVLAKRCNEHFEVAPRSEIGMYLGDIQDHIVTMTGNLSHYENLLSRSHSNYLAQINIRMNERAEKTNDILGKLTVIGTIVLPMNIITGLWGMNCLVPGQDIESLTWFWCLTAGLIVFGMTSFLFAKWRYKIV